MKNRNIITGLLLITVVFAAFCSYKYFPFENLTTDAIFKSSMIALALIALWFAWTSIRTEFHSRSSRALVTIPMVVLVCACIKGALHIPIAFLRYQHSIHGPHIYATTLRAIHLANTLLKGCVLALAIAFLVLCGIEIGKRLNPPTDPTADPYPARGDSIRKPQ